MSENMGWIEMARLPVAKIQDVLLARFIGRNEATKMGFSPAALTRISTAISEIARNVVQHAGCPGEIQFGRVTERGASTLRIIVTDKGKGIEHPARFLEESKLGTLGAGLPGTRKLVDAFSLKSSLGSGTTVTMDFLKREDST